MSASFCKCVFRTKNRETSLNKQKMGAQNVKQSNFFHGADSQALADIYFSTQQRPEL